MKQIYCNVKVLYTELAILNLVFCIVTFFLVKVKGLSIEHEKLAVAQSHSSSSNLDSSIEPRTRKDLKVLKDEVDTSNSNHHQSSPSPSYSPAMSPYMHHYRPYDQQMGSNGNSFESGGNSMKRQLRSPNELLQVKMAVGYFFLELHHIEI